MESLFVTFLIIAAFLPKSTDINSVVLKYDYKNNFRAHLSLSKSIDLPYRARGAPIFDASQITAQSAMAVDEKTGKILFEKNSYNKQSIASLTKLMTAIVWLERDGGLNKEIEIKNEDIREGGIAYFLAGEKIKAKDLLYAGLIGSSNMAMAALARNTTTSTEEFVSLMNKKAKELGMENTRFKDPTGLDYHNISTASDIYLLMKEAFGRQEIYKATQLSAYNFYPLGKGYPRAVKNTNWLLNSSLNSGAYKIVGGKTGYIEESNYNLALRVYNSEKNKNIAVIILGSADKQSRFIEAKKLTEWVFGNYIWQI